jgi:hypothetical protein
MDGVLHRGGLGRDRVRGDQRFLALLDEMGELHVRKAAGYGAADDAWANFRGAAAYGVTPLQGCLVRFNDKVIRTQNLLRDPANDKVGESLRDTLMDAASYALIAICLLEEEARGTVHRTHPRSEARDPSG